MQKESDCGTNQSSERKRESKCNKESAMIFYNKKKTKMRISIFPLFRWKCWLAGQEQA